MNDETIRQIADEYGLEIPDADMVHFRHARNEAALRRTLQWYRDAQPQLDAPTWTSTEQEQLAYIERMARGLL